MKEKNCYMCIHYIGEDPDDDIYEDGLEGMCPHTSVYTNAYNCACDEFECKESYK